MLKYPLSGFAHFKQYSRNSPENRCLLIFDGHGSHKTLAAINFCREIGIDISLPPYTTNKLHPLIIGQISSPVKLPIIETATLG